MNNMCKCTYTSRGQKQQPVNKPKFIKMTKKTENYEVITELNKGSDFSPMAIVKEVEGCHSFHMLQASPSNYTHIYKAYMCLFEI